MSFEFSAMAIRAECDDVSEKMVLLILSDTANENGICWPSVNYIAKCGCMSLSTAKRRVSSLIKKGFLIKQSRFNKNENRYLSNIYQLNKKKLSEFLALEQSSITEFMQQNNIEGVGSHRTEGVGSHRTEGGFSQNQDPINDPITTTTLLHEQELRPVDSLKIDEIPDDFEMALHLSGFSGNPRIWEIWSTFYSYIRAEQDDSPSTLNRHRLLQKFKNFLSTERIYQQKKESTNAKKYKAKSEQSLTVADKRRLQMRSQGYDV